MKKLDTTPTLFAPEKVAEIAAEMAAEDEDWDYVVDLDPTGKGYARIKVLEDGEFIAFV